MATTYRLVLNNLTQTFSSFLGCLLVAMRISVERAAILILVGVIVSGGGCTTTEETTSSVVSAAGGRSKPDYKYSDDYELNPAREYLVRHPASPALVHSVILPTLVRDAVSGAVLIAPTARMALGELDGIRRRLDEDESGEKKGFRINFRHLRSPEEIILRHRRIQVVLDGPKPLLLNMSGNAVHLAHAIGGDDAPLPAVVSDDGIAVPNSLVVKYETDCRSYPSALEHPLVSEFVFQKYVADRIGIAPFALYLSSAVEVPEWSDEKVVGSCGRKIYNPHPNVRFMVMQQVGATLGAVAEHFETKKIPTDFPFLFRMFRNCVTLLEKLHLHGIVHGDIHMGNIAFRDPQAPWNVNNPDLVLIDFGRARFYPLDDELLAAAKAGAHDTKTLLSPWELEGHRKAPRDDVFRLFVIFAFAVQGEQNLFDLLKPEGAMDRWKFRSPNLFATVLEATGGDPMGLFEPELGLVYSTLMDLTVHLRKLDSPEKLPNYNLIRDGIDRGIELMDARVVGVPATVSCAPRETQTHRIDSGRHRRGR